MFVATADPRLRAAIDEAKAQRGALVRSTVGRIFRPGSRSETR